ncbi:MAG: TetR/AcrR family transcriptional regulator [Actinomycetaceae bacterium]|nr:TetR/AcrR family transcriptional regulator [Actinomycetaceae bacterium]
MRRPWRPAVGRKPSFSCDEVVDKALEIGLDNFTMAGIAKQLGVVPSALYRLFPSRDDILAKCLQRIGVDTPRTNPDDTWQDQLYDMCEQFWALCEKYPGFATVLYIYPAPHLYWQDSLEFTVNNLVNAGIPGGKKRAIFALKILGDIVTQIYAIEENMRRKDKNGVTMYEKMQQRLEEHKDDLRVGFVPEKGEQGRLWYHDKVSFIIDSLGK